MISVSTCGLYSQAENTFLLALDGDVDFKPDAVRLLVDRMRKNCKTGAACGRIHPIGAGRSTQSKCSLCVHACMYTCIYVCVL